MKKASNYQESTFFCFWQVLALAAGLSLCVSQSAALPLQPIASEPSAPHSDLRTLLEIKGAIWSDPEGALENWTIANGGSYCQWRGVNCSSDRVTSLQLKGLGLVGTISNYIRNLSNLSTLDLRNNSLTGPIPEGIGRCTQLEYIYLDNNRLNGSIPTELGYLSRVKHIKLAKNLLSGPIPRNLCSVLLRELDLSNNKLSGQIPDSFMENCTKLDILHLDENQLTGDIPMLIKVTEGFFNDQFKELYLQGNQLTGPVPSYLEYFSLLRELHLERNKLTGQIPPQIKELKRLFFSLNFSHNSLSGSIPREMGSIECLVEVDLSHNNLSGEIPRALVNMSSLTKIDLSYNSLRGPIPNFTQRNLTTNFEGNDMLCGPRVRKNCSLAPTPTHIRSKSSTKSEMWGKSVAGVSAVLAAFVVVVGVVVQRERSRKAKVHTSGGPEIISRGQLFEPGLRQITVRELRQATNNFSPEHLIGKGSSTLVYRAVLDNVGWKKTSTEVAVKKLFVDDDFARSQNRLIREIESMKDLQHRNLVKILGYALNMDVLALILEYMPNGSLEQALHGSVDCVLTLNDRYKIAVSVARGLVYLHHDRDEAVAHLDIKPGNILLDAELEARIADFGGTRLVCPALRLDSQTMTCNFTVGYTAPEFVDYARPSTKADVYSFGIVLLELFTRVRPTASIFGESGTITQWMTDAILDKSALTLVDPVLRAMGLTTDEENKILTMLHVAVNCTHRDPDRRPEMNLILEILENLQSSNQTVPVAPSLADLVKEEDTVVDISTHHDQSL